MYKLAFEKRALKVLQNLKKEEKVYIQVISKILELLENPFPNDCKKIKGKKTIFFRVDSGEFRVNCPAS